MSNKNTNTNECTNATRILGPILPIYNKPIQHSINIYTVDVNTGNTTTGNVAYCDSNRSIRCDISITPGAKFKSINKVLLLLKSKDGAGTEFQVHNNSGSTIYGDPPFAYVDNRCDSNGNISYRVIDITSNIYGSQSQTVSLIIESISGDYCSVYTTGALLELEYLEDDDFISNVSKLERNIGAKGAYSVNTRNGKLFYTQKLIQGKGGRMPLALSMTYNAADCDTSSPNEISTGIKGWTFNYAQTLKTSTSNYTLLDGAHTYRTFKEASNDSSVKHDVSSKSGLYLNETSDQYIISNGNETTYKFNTEKRLTEIVTTGGSSAITTSITYYADGKIASITDGMSDTYTFIYIANSIVISKGDTALVQLTITDERLTQVKYLLSNEVYTFTYNSDSELLGVTDGASNEKTAFEYYDSHAIYAVKNYIMSTNSNDDTIESPVDCYFIDYRVLETHIEKCRNSDSKIQSYSKSIYTFAENGETISVCEGGQSGVFKNMRFKSQNDYEKYIGKIIDFSSVQNGTSAGGVFTFNENAPSTSITVETTGLEIQPSNALTINIPGYIDSNCIFSAKLLVENTSYSNASEQFIKLFLKDNAGNLLATLDFDPKKRGYQVQSAMLQLPYGMNTLQVDFKVFNMRAKVQLSEVFIFQTKISATLEYVSDFANDDGVVVNDGERNLYLNNGGFSLRYGSEEYTNIRYTAKDYALTTISRLKNPNSFNIWYNDGADMLADVGSQWTLEQNSIIKSLVDVKCCQVTMGVNKTVISGVDESELSDGFIKSKTISRVAKEAEDENGATFTDYDNFYSTTHFDEYLQPIKSVNKDDIVTEFTYNEFGEVLAEKAYPASNANLNILSSRTYQNGNLASITEKRYDREYTRMFEYNDDDVLTNEITANGQYISYVHTSDGEKLTELKADVGGMNANTVIYSGNLTESLTHNDTAITFVYDERNNVNDVKVAESSILSITRTYGARNMQTLTEYANGVKIKRYHDRYNHLIKVTEINGENETQLCAYLYSDAEVEDGVIDPEDSALNRNASSKLRVFIDNVANTRTNYIYNEYGELIKKQVGDVIENVGHKDEYERVDYLAFNDGTATVSDSIFYENNYSNEIQRESIQSPAGYTSVYYSRDALKRSTNITVTQNRTGYERQLSYVPRGTADEPEGTTNYIESITYYNVVNDVRTYEKTENVEYNADGNIIRYGENTYEYDRIGRLVRENNKILDKTFVFEYNVGGNIVSKNEYVYCEGMLEGEPAKMYSYAYGNAWRDQLTSFDGQNIIYDVVGNPTNYLGATLAWSRGRLLTNYVKGYNTVSMQYDANGLRTHKTTINTNPNTIGDIYSTSYIYDSNGRLRTETKDGVTRRYLYSSNGVEGFEEDGERYLYRKNLFGNITAIYNGATKVAEYAYDAWGNCTIIQNTNGIGTRNPFRYRGYYFDTDLNLYYLLTRYYDPKTGRFINADSLEYLDPNKINGLNLYAYCRNNPVMYVDPSGTEAYLVTIYAFSWDGHGGIPIVGHSVLLFKGKNGDWYMTEYSGDNKAKAKVNTVKVKESSLRRYIENNYLPSILKISEFIPGIENMPFGFLSIGYSVVPIDGDYSALDETTKIDLEKIDFEENYHLIKNNCGHYVMKFLATHYNGTLLSRDFFVNMRCNPIPAILTFATSVYRGFSILWQDIQKW